MSGRRCTPHPLRFLIPPKGKRAKRWTSLDQAWEIRVLRTGSAAKQAGPPRPPHPAGVLLSTSTPLPLASGKKYYVTGGLPWQPSFPVKQPGTDERKLFALVKGLVGKHGVGGLCTASSRILCSSSSPVLFFREWVRDGREPEVLAQAGPEEPGRVCPQPAATIHSLPGLSLPVSCPPSPWSQKWDLLGRQKPWAAGGPWVPTGGWVIK